MKLENLNLAVELQDTLADLNVAIDGLKERARVDYYDTPWVLMMDRTGKLIAQDILLAKVNCMYALALLHTKE